MFRGKECSNKIKLSRLVEFWCFGLPVGLGVGGGWMGVGSGWGVPPTHVHMHTHVHACTCTYSKHDNFMQVAAPIGGIPGNSL